MKPILLVAYHYPPEGSSSGVLRALKFSKYLPHHGWRPHVLTLRESAYRVKDEGLLRDVPAEAVVHRTRGRDGARWLGLGKRYISLFTVPDRFASWLPFGIARGLRVIRSAGVRALYSTSPQPTAHLIAAALKGATGLPWIADFRDPWIEEGNHPRPGSLRYRVESRLEALVIRNADRISVTTPYLRGDFLGRYRDLPPDKVRVIYNGYDEADFADMDGPVRSGRFEILHAGLVTRDYRDPAPLLEVVAALIADGRIAPGTVRIRFLGDTKYLTSHHFTEGVRGLGLAEVVEVLPRIPHREALAMLRQASCLLLLQASHDTRSLIPAKAFEYLRVGRPILALTPEGATSDLLKEIDHCWVVNPSDGARLRNAVLGLYQEWRAAPEAVVVARNIEHFERGNLTAGLAQILHELDGE